MENTNEKIEVEAVVTEVKEVKEEEKKGVWNWMKENKGKLIAGGIVVAAGIAGFVLGSKNTDEDNDVDSDDYDVYSLDNTNDAYLLVKSEDDSSESSEVK